MINSKQSVPLAKNVMTPHEIWRGKKPNMKHFHEFRSTCFELNDGEHRRKFDPKSDEGMFLGYSLNSRAYNTHNPPINDEFAEESLLLVENTPWYAHIANYLATGELPADWKAQDKKFFFAKIHSYYWEKPFLYKYYVVQIIRRCVPEEEQLGILSHYHENACGGHFASQKTALKVLQSGFY